MCNAQNHTVDLYNCSSYHMPRRVRVCAVEWRKARAAGAARPLTLITLKTSERYSAVSAQRCGAFQKRARRGADTLDHGSELRHRLECGLLGDEQCFDLRVHAPLGRSLLRV